MKPTCEDCRFWQEIDADVHYGQCRRHPLGPLHWAQTEGKDGSCGDRTAVWPTTDGDDWCGEHVPASRHGADGAPDSEPESVGFDSDDDDIWR